MTFYSFYEAPRRWGSRCLKQLNTSKSPTITSAQPVSLGRAMRFTQPRRPHPSPSKAALRLPRPHFTRQRLFLSSLTLNDPLVPFLHPETTCHKPPSPITRRHYLSFTCQHSSLPSPHPLPLSSSLHASVSIPLFCIFMYSTGSVAISRVDYSWQLHAIILVPSWCHLQVTLNAISSPSPSTPPPCSASLRQGNDTRSVRVTCGRVSPGPLPDTDQGGNVLSHASSGPGLHALALWSSSGGRLKR